jgi:hypothetical protein
MWRCLCFAKWSASYSEMAGALCGEYPVGAREQESSGGSTDHKLAYSSDLRNARVRMAAANWSGALKVKWATEIKTADGEQSFKSLRIFAIAIKERCSPHRRLWSKSEIESRWIHFDGKNVRSKSGLYKDYFFNCKTRPLKRRLVLFSAY